MSLQDVHGHSSCQDNFILYLFIFLYCDVFERWWNCFHMPSSNICIIPPRMVTKQVIFQMNFWNPDFMYLSAVIHWRQKNHHFSTEMARSKFYDTSCFCLMSLESILLLVSPRNWKNFIDLPLSLIMLFSHNR